MGDVAPSCAEERTDIVMKPNPDVHPLVIAAGRFLVEEGDIEEAMGVLSAFFEAEARKETHPTVVALLESCRDSARAISFEWYASFK